MYWKRSFCSYNCMLGVAFVVVDRKTISRPVVGMHVREGGVMDVRPMRRGPGVVPPGRRIPRGGAGGGGKRWWPVGV